MYKLASAVMSGLLILVLSSTSSAALGTTTFQAHGLTIAPSIEQLSIAAGQKSLSFNEQVTNNTKTSVTVNISTTDFTAYNETGGVTFLPNITNRAHGLAQWLKPATSIVVLAAGQTQTIPIVITPTADFALGGHYGALVYRLVSTNKVGSGNQVINNEEISSLVFVTTASGNVDAISLDKPSIGYWHLKIPSTVNLVINNTGNTQVTPTGVVAITNSSNKLIAKGIINQDSGLVLPGTTRLYSVNLTRTNESAYIGDYSLLVSYQASASTKATLYSTHFYLLNKTVIYVVIILGLVCITFLNPNVRKRARISHRKRRQ